MFSGHPRANTSTQAGQILHNIVVHTPVLPTRVIFINIVRADTHTPTPPVLAAGAQG